MANFWEGIHGVEAFSVFSSNDRTAFDSYYKRPLLCSSSRSTILQFVGSCCAVRLQPGASGTPSVTNGSWGAASKNQGAWDDDSFAVMLNSTSKLSVPNGLRRGHYYSTHCNALCRSSWLKEVSITLKSVIRLLQYRLIFCHSLNFLSIQSHILWVKYEGKCGRQIGPYGARLNWVRDLVFWTKLWDIYFFVSIVDVGTLEQLWALKSYSKCNEALFPSHVLNWQPIL